jgi:uncharacterized membrane protein YdjX (TVP38/TMEM64 family)
MRSWIGLIGAGLTFVLVTGALIVGIQALGLERIRAAIEGAGIFAPLIFIGVKILTYVFAPLTSGPIQIGAGVLFGLVPGTIYTLIGEVIGGSLSFLIARRWGHPVVRRLVGTDGLRRVDNFVSQIVDWRSLLYARLFLFSIYDFISYAAGFSQVSLRAYLVISTVAGAIPTFIAVALGTTLTEERGGLILVYVIVAVACAIPLIFRRRIRRWIQVDS